MKQAIELYTDEASGCCIDRRTGRVVAVFKPTEAIERADREATAKRMAEQAMAKTAILRRVA